MRPARLSARITAPKTGPEAGYEPLLDGGVNDALKLDTHGEALSYLLPAGAEWGLPWFFFFAPRVRASRPAPAARSA